MNFNIETVSNILSLILKMDEQLDMDFEAEKDEDGSFILSTIKLSKVFLMTARLLKKTLEIYRLKYIPTINHSHYAEK